MQRKNYAKKVEYHNNCGLGGLLWWIKQGLVHCLCETEAYIVNEVFSQEDILC